jgi:hypothetical protein
MKKLLITAIAAASTIAGMQITHADTLTNGLIAYYPFNENGNDASGNGRNLTIYQCEYTNGLRGSSLKFNPALHAPVSCRAEYLNNPAGPRTNALTYSIWLKPSTLNKDYAGGGMNPGGGWMYLFSGSTTDSGYLRLGIATNEPANYKTFWLGFSSPSDVGYGYRTPQVSRLVTDRWQHIVATAQGKTYKIYLNGSPVSSITNAGPISFDPNNFSIGNDASFGLYPVIGQVDEVRIYKRAITQDEVTALYNLDHPKPVVVYALTGTGNASAASTNKNQNFSGYFTADDSSQLTAFIWFGGTPSAKTYTLEKRTDIDVQSTASGICSKVLYSFAYTNGVFPNVEKDMIWLSGSNSLVSLNNSIKTIAPATMTGILNNLTIQGGTVIENQNSTLTLDKTNTLSALTNNETLDAAISRLTNNLKTQGYLPAP